MLPFLETGLTPALLQPAGISLTLQEPSKMTAAQQSPLQLPRHSWFVLLGPEGLCALILPGPSPARPSSPSPALLSPLYLFPCSGISEGQKTKLERELCLGKQSSGKKRHSWVLLGGFVLGKKCRVVFRALLVTPGNDTGKAAGPKGGTAQGLHEPELPWTSAVCSGQGLEGFGTALSF